MLLTNAHRLGRLASSSSAPTTEGAQVDAFFRVLLVIPLVFCFGRLSFRSTEVTVHPSEQPHHRNSEESRDHPHHDDSSRRRGRRTQQQTFTTLTAALLGVLLLLPGSALSLAGAREEGRARRRRRDARASSGEPAPPHQAEAVKQHPTPLSYYYNRRFLFLPIKN